jgi:branched-chain amino acid transport system ATP-binding protein
VALLEVKGLTKRFGGLTAVNRLDLAVEEKEILGLIGPNGAGKSTVFNLISGVHPPTGGRVWFGPEEITGRPRHVIAGKGIVRTFQATALFHEYSLLENVRIARHLHLRTGLWRALVHSRAYRMEERENTRKAAELLDVVGLASVMEDLAKNLPHGHQRALGVAIAMATEPVLMMLDEPLTGMNRGEASAMMDIIRKIRERGITILLVEHDMRAVMGLCERIVVLNYGNKIAEGSPGEIKGNPAVIEAYLGTESGDA